MPDIATLEAKRVERRELYERMRAINAKAVEQKRNLRPDEQNQYDDLSQRQETLADEVRALEQQLDTGPRMTRRAANGGATGFDPASSQLGPTLTGEQRMTDWQAAQPQRGNFTREDLEDFNLGSVIRALVEPAYRSQLNDAEKRALVEGTDSAGGFWTPEPLAARIIDRVRNQAVVFQAGATTVPLTSDKQAIPRLTGGVTPVWRAENDAYGLSDPTFDRVNFAVKNLGVEVKFSDELWEDMVDGGHQVIENEITSALALELDRAALRGDGTSNAPTGVRSQSGVTLQSLGVAGAQPTYANVMTAVSTLLGANRTPSGIVMAPRTSQGFAGLVDSTGQPLNPPKPVADLPWYISNQIPVNLDSSNAANHDTSEIYVAYWPDLLVGVRLAMEIRFLSELYAHTGQLALRARLRADVQLQHTTSFVVVTGVRP